MKANYKKREKINERKDLITNTIKIFLLALRHSEGFGKNKLLRVLYEYTQLQNEANFNNDEMLIVDRELEKVLGKEVIDSIGREPFEINN